MTQRELTIGALSNRTGLAVSAIRFYEERGMIKPNRTAASHRRFRKSDIRRLSFIKIMQELGYPLADIADYLSGLPDDRTPTKADWKKVSRKIRQSIDQRIAMLENLRYRLDGCIGCGCLSLTTCALYNPGDKAFERGTGARFLMN